MHAPLRFVPHLRPLVWGGRALGDRLGKDLPDADAYGESWEISDHPSHPSVVAEGPFAGQTLRELMARHAALLLGESGDPPVLFPWLLKFLDACDWLSVQVHPDAERVKQLWPGEGSKTEAWFVLSASPKARIYAGLLPRVDEAQLRHALAEGQAATLLHQFTPRPGDCVYLPSGTVHAVGGGVLFAEIQQTSDATFRLFDWNRRDAHGRSRTLHIEEGLACIHWAQGPVHPVRAGAYGKDEEAVPQTLVTSPHFTLAYHKHTLPLTLGGTGQLQVLVAVEGAGTLDSADGPLAVRAGETILLPACLPPRAARPEGRWGFLLATLPPRSAEARAANG